MQKHVALDDVDFQGGFGEMHRVCVRKKALVTMVSGRGGGGSMLEQRLRARLMKEKALSAVPQDTDGCSYESY